MMDYFLILDFLFFILIIGLKLLTILLVQPLAQIGVSLALGHLNN